MPRSCELWVSSGTFELSLLLFFVPRAALPARVFLLDHIHFYGDYIGLGAMDVTKPYTFIWFGDFYGPQPYEFIGVGVNSWKN